MVCLQHRKATASAFGRTAVDAQGKAVSLSLSVTCLRSTSRNARMSAAADAAARCRCRPATTARRPLRARRRRATAARPRRPRRRRGFPGSRASARPTGAQRQSRAADCKPVHDRAWVFERAFLIYSHSPSFDLQLQLPAGLENIGSARLPAECGCAARLAITT